MSSLNKATIIGYLGRDPEVKFLDNGDAVCNFSIATSESWTGKDNQKHERTEWHRITAWRKLAEICGKYLSKGRQCYVEGKIQSRKYQGKDGTEKVAYEIIASQVVFLGSGKGDEAKAPQSREPGSDDNPPPQTDDDVAF